MFFTACSFGTHPGWLRRHPHERSFDRDHLAGGVSLFGVSQASDPDGSHAGNGITFTLEITKIIDKLHLGGDFDVDQLSVEFVPLDTIPDTAEVRIGRISVFRQFE